ncbi:MAG: hypothetical protein L3J63_09350, partial [Geopsychrobacter sp.]|nr:hypothetical protein [Geopsychrobacter sp.]
DPQSDGQINAQDFSIAQTHEQVTVTARVMEIEVRPYQMEQNICSFKLLVRNDRDQPIYLPAERFILSDRKGNQYRPVSPAKIREIVADLDPYLIPYPYVGYYYEGDVERSRIRNEFNSEVTYFPTKNPQNIALEALPEGRVEPGKQISGLIYFLADLRTMEGFTLESSAVLAKGVKSSDFIFPFSVVKK